MNSHNFWKTPDNSTFLSFLIQEYDIKYVLVTSVSGYQDWFGGKAYVQKPFNSDTRDVFDQNSLVQLVYEYGKSAVYKVKEC